MLHLSDSGDNKTSVSCPLLDPATMMH